MPSRDPATCDLAILGGGLAGSVIALAMAARRPELRVLLVERGERLGGEHVWSFFASDLAPETAEILEPAVAARWDGYEVRFPDHARRLGTAYASITSRSLDAAVRAALPEGAIWCGTAVAAADRDSVSLADGRTIRARGVIDARGSQGLHGMRGGWQKFLGQRLRLQQPHGLERPVVMDARVAQVDGYRFVYCLPFGANEVFVEDTYYTEDPALDRPLLRSRIADYGAQQGWRIETVVYEETGVLPVIAAGDFAAFWRAGADGPARAGTRAALLHPLTSYSLPDAARFALHLTTLDNLSAEALEGAGHDWAAQHWRRGRFYRMLSRMLFGAARPEARWRMLARFYRLPEPLIERFYAGRSTALDKARILAGRPPVAIGAALKAIAGGGHPLARLGTAP